MSLFRLLPRLSAIFLILLVSLHAQGPTGEINGTVSDATGAVIPGATVTVTNPATGAVRKAASNASGVFSIPSILPGTYNVRVESEGFGAQLRNDVILQVGQSVTVDFSLAVGNVAEVIEVTGGAPVLQAETAELGTVIENKRILELPLNGRNYLQLASLVPGATTDGPASSQGQQRMGGARNKFSLNVAGQRVSFNHYSLDGIENTDPNFNTYLFLPSIEALQEFAVESGIFQAEYGRAIAQVNVSTRGGTNQFRGTAFEFIRNAKLDAKNYFDKPNEPIPPFKRNQFGFVIGGPVYIPKVIDGRNKLFFMMNYEGLRERKALTNQGTLPIAVFRNGDFSSLNRPLFDPATRVFNANGQVVSVSPFPGNIIPANRIHPTSRKIFERFYPLPNQGDPNLPLANNFLNIESQRSDSDQFTWRADWNQNAGSTWFFRYSTGGDLEYRPSTAPNQGNNADIDVHQGVGSNTWIVSPNKVNEFRFGVSRLVAANVQQRANVENVVAELNIPDVSRDFPLYWGIPVFQISGFSNIGECNDCPFINYDTISQIRDDFSWITGKHSFKFGADIRHTMFNQIGAVVPRGRFSFDGRYTQDPTAANRTSTGYPVADFLLGNMNNSEGQVGAPIATFLNYQLAFYIQDTWRVNRKLTLNLGLRWENEPPYRDKFDNIVNIDFRWDNSMEPTYVRLGEGDPYEGNPPFRLPASVNYVRDGRFGNRAGVNDLNDWAPRVGLAYQINDKTVLRSGGGIYYVRDIGNAVFDVVRNAPFTIRRNEPADQLVPNLSWERPFTQTGVPTFILVNQHGERTSYVGQWSFGLQRQLFQNTSLEATYLGSTGVKLRRLMTYNNAQPGEGNVNDRRPFPKFGGFQVMSAPAHSSYHSLQMRLQHRFSRGLTVLSSFAWSKSIDNGSGIRTTDGDSLTPANDYNLDGERGLSAFDFRRRLTTSWIYELPVGKGKALLAGGGPAAAILGDWQLGGILTLQDGFPLTARCGPGNIQNGGGQCYPDATGINPNLDADQQTVQRFFNTDAFVDRLPGGPRFRYGNSGRNTIIGPGIINWDFSAIKNFNFGEDRRLEFRAEAFNLPNHPIFAPPGTSLRTPTYGVISGTKIDSRQLQFGLKLHF